MNPMTKLFDPSRLTGRFFYLLVAFLAACGTARAVAPLTTTVSDIVYRADGNPASGTLLITWPQFNTADDKAVAAGTLNVSIATGGAVNVALVPNAGASPAGTFYKVTYKLDDGTSSTEYWTVPSASPTTISAIRSTVVPASMAVQVVSRSYVDSGLALKAADAAVLHKSGDTMTGALTLSADPSAAMQAATKSYVDTHAGGSTPGQIIVDGSTYPNIHSAVVAAGTTGSVLIPATYSGTDTDPNPNKIQIMDLRGKPNRQRGFINMLTDCGLKGDGVTDDASAAQACFNNYPSYWFVFPQTQSGGACSYWFGATVFPKGEGARISGASSGYKNSNTTMGGTVICAAAGVTPFWLDMTPNSSSGITIENLSIKGSEGHDHLQAPTKLNIPADLPQYKRNIATAQRTSNVLSITVTPTGSEGLTQQVGSQVKISGVSDSTVNGICIVASLTNSNAFGENALGFTCNQNGADTGALGAGGTISLPTTGTSTADGIRVCSNFNRIRNVTIDSMGRHGINADMQVGHGCTTNFSDDLIVEDSTIAGNQGDGFYAQGIDSNAGTMSINPIYYNLLWGVEDQSALGNNWTNNQISNNGSAWSTTSAPAAKNISAISRALASNSSTVSVTLSSADTNIKVGSCVVIAGVTDSSFNNTAGQCYFVTTLTDSTHYQYIQPGAPANASSSGGTSRMAKFSEAYLSAGIDSGAVKIGTQSQVQNQPFVGNYVEGGQDCKFGGTTLTFGGSNVPTCVSSTTWKPVYFLANTPGIVASTTNIAGFSNEKDFNNSVFFKAGKSSGTIRHTLVRWMNNNTSLDAWGLDVDPSGTAGSTGSWILGTGTAGSAIAVSRSSVQERQVASLVSVQNPLAGCRSTTTPTPAAGASRCALAARARHARRRPLSVPQTTTSRTTRPPRLSNRRLRTPRAQDRYGWRRRTRSISGIMQTPQTSQHSVSTPATRLCFPRLPP